MDLPSLLTMEGGGLSDQAYAGNSTYLKIMVQNIISRITEDCWTLPARQHRCTKGFSTYQQTFADGIGIRIHFSARNLQTPV